MKNTRDILSELYSFMDADDHNSPLFGRPLFPVVGLSIGTVAFPDYSSDTSFFSSINFILWSVCFLELVAADSTFARIVISNIIIPFSVHTLNSRCDLFCELFSSFSDSIPVILPT